MKKAFAILLLALSSLLPGQIQAQSEIPVFTWRSHTSYRNVIDIAAGNGLIYAAADNGLFFVDLQENSITRITKNDGLSDVGIGAIGYAADQNVLIVGYTNGNIDLVEANAITNINTFRDATVFGGKVIRDITFNAGLAYLSTDQGILVMDLDRQEIIESYTDLDEEGDRLAISGTAFSGDSIYAASDNGILSASLGAGINRQDFNNWQRQLTGQSFSEVVVDGINGWAASDQSLFRYENSNWASNRILDEPISSLRLQGDQLLFLSNNLLNTLDNGLLTTAPLGDDGVANTFIILGNDIWLGDQQEGLVQLRGGQRQSFLPSGPANDNSWRLFGEENISLVHGGHDENLNALNRPAELSQFVFDSGWNLSPIVINSLIANDLVDMETLSLGEDLTQFLASFDRGLIRNGETPEVVNESSANSTLNSTGNSVRMTALAREGESLWMTNYGFTQSLHQWDPATDTWTAFSPGISQARYPIDLFIADNGDKWMPIDPEEGGGIVVFNESSGAVRRLTTNGGQGGLPGAEVTSLALDQNFFLWVGTNEGIAFYPNLRSVLNGEPLTASVPIFENRVLLRDEFVTAVAIDPGNRKWIGTRTNGIWLFSETGEEQVFHFTADNSPLLSDNITAIKVHPGSGEVFIGTDKGLVSFRSDATQGTSRHENVEIYPNPVRPGFNRDVVINGLVNNALVKITDVSGKLVREIRAQGSTALWNSRDYNGQRVKTGVYLVFSTNRDGTETFVGKIAVI